jgi:predicted acyltransferase
VKRGRVYFSAAAGQAKAPKMSTTSPQSRIASLDQFRGYTVAGMFLVNFVGSFAAIKATLPVLAHHHTYFSYADSIMPQFFLAVGFAYRLTFLRRREKEGAGAAYSHALKRNFGLLLLGFVVHHLDGKFETWESLRETGFRGFITTGFQRNFFQTLTHIGVTGLWVLPVIAAPAPVRIVFAAASAVAFHYLSDSWYYAWVMKRPGIDGGPLGFLTWTVPLIAGTLVYDVMSSLGRMKVLKLIALGTALMIIGYGLACLNLVTPPNTGTLADGWKSLLVEGPFFPPSRPVNIWTISQRAGSVSYLTFGAGFGVALYALFVILCDGAGLHVGIFRTFGSNALAGYVIHDLISDAVKPFVPKDSPLWYIGLAFALFLGICYVFIRYLEKNRLYVKL